MRCGALAPIGRSWCLRLLDRAFDVERGAGVKGLGAGAEAASGDEAGAPRLADGAGKLILIGRVRGNIDERAQRSGHPVSRACGDVIGGKLGVVKRYSLVAHGEPGWNRQMDIP